MTKLQSLASGATTLSAEDEKKSKSAVAGVDMNQLKTLTADMNKLKGTTAGKKTGKKEGFTGMPSFMDDFMGIFKRKE
jgi:hypothetical protein